MYLFFFIISKSNMKSKIISVCCVRLEKICS